MAEHANKNIAVETFGSVPLKCRDSFADKIEGVNLQVANSVNTPIRHRLTTEELAVLLRVKPQTIRAGLCKAGHYLGMRPAVKLPNRRLLWDGHQAASLLNT